MTTSDIRIIFETYHGATVFQHWVSKLPHSETMTYQRATLTDQRVRCVPQLVKVIPQGESATQQRVRFCQQSAQPT